MKLRELAKQAGEVDALAEFGLTHGTPKPPPTWAQDWQGLEHKNVTKKVTIPSMQQMKLAAVPTATKMYRRALQSLKGGTGGHDTGPL